MIFLKHSRDTVGDFQYRVLLHIPIGLLIGIPILGKPVRVLFKAYEENEDLHTKDEAWKDYFGAIIGAVIMTLACLGFVIWILLKLMGG